MSRHLRGLNWDRRLLEQVQIHHLECLQGEVPEGKIDWGISCILMYLARVVLSARKTRTVWMPRWLNGVGAKCLITSECSAKGNVSISILLCTLRMLCWKHVRNQATQMGSNENFWKAVARAPPNVWHSLQKNPLLTGSSRCLPTSRLLEPYNCVELLSIFQSRF